MIICLDLFKAMFGIAVQIIKRAFTIKNALSGKNWLFGYLLIKSFFSSKKPKTTISPKLKFVAFDKPHFQLSMRAAVLL
jgi:hypothetical protein